MLNTYQIPLSGLNCGKCVAKVREGLQALNNTEIISVSKEMLEVRSATELNTVVTLINNMGFKAGYQFKLLLSGLNCGKCVAKVENSLRENSLVLDFTVSKSNLSLTTLLSLSQVISIIDALGFTASAKSDSDAQVDGQTESVSKGEQTDANTSVGGIRVKPLGASKLASPKLSGSALTPTSFTSIDKATSKLDLTNSSAPQLTSAKTHVDAASIPSDQAKSKQATNTQATNLILQGMTCASCVASVEKACLSVEQIERVQINLAEQTASVFIKTSSPQNRRDIEQDVINAISQAGYAASIVEDEASQQQELQASHTKAQQQHKNNAIIALALGGPLMLWGLVGGNMMIRNSGDQLAWGVVGLLCLAMLSSAGKLFFQNAWKSLTHRRATMDTLVAIGTGAAWLYSSLVVLVPHWFPHASRHVYYEASAMIIGLISLGHFIEAKAKARTTQSLQALIGLQPKFATVKQGGTEIKLAIEQIELDMQVRIKPGEKVPVDGKVIQGESYIDEAMLTGEPIGKLKTLGDTVSAGTINGDGSLLIQATGVGSQTMLARIIQLVRQAQSSKPQIAKLADAISAVFVPVVMVIAAVSSGLWWWLGPEPQTSYMLVVATTVLIIACPCALGLATPLSVTVGVGKAAELGILIKDADVLQTASKINTVVFDKTGTLTEGKPSVREFKPLNGMPEAELLDLVYSLESHSEHPLAQAVCQYAESQQAKQHELSEIITERGKGISGIINGKRLTIGSPNFIATLDTQFNSDILNQYIEQAWTPVAVALDNKAIGIIAISDPIKSESKQAVEALISNNIKVVLLSGDNQKVAEKIAKQMGITHTIAQVLPDEKAEHIKRLQQQSGNRVAMVGDGINDAPALAQADIGIAMGSGSDVAIESAQITLLNSSPMAVNHAIKLSKATLKNMHQNLFAAFIYNIVCIPIAAGALYPMFGFLLSPVFAGAAMALSSISVVTNANRLRLVKIDR